MDARFYNESSPHSDIAQSSPNERTVLLAMLLSSFVCMYSLPLSPTFYCVHTVTLSSSHALSFSKENVDSQRSDGDSFSSNKVHFSSNRSIAPLSSRT